MGTYVKGVGYVNPGSKIFSSDPKGFRVWDGKVWNVKAFPDKGTLVGTCDGSVVVNQGGGSVLDSYGTHKIGITWQEGNATLSGYVYSNFVFTLDGYSGQAKNVDAINVPASVRDTVTIEFLGNKKVELTGSIYNSESTRNAFVFIMQDNDVADLCIKYIKAIHWTDAATIYRIQHDGVDSEGYFKVDGLKISKSNLLSFLGKFAGFEDVRTYDWNTSIQSEIDQTSGVTDDINNPQNPNSPYYSANGVFAYDKEYGVIVYKNGQIVWTGTGDKFQVESDGTVTGYDSQNKVVTYSSGTTLNLLTNERTTIDKQITTIRETQSWIQKLFNDTKMWYWIIGGLVILVLFKRQRNAE